MDQLDNLPYAETFDDGQTVKVVLLSNPSSTGLVKVEAVIGAKKFVRHKTRLHALNKEAVDILNGNQDK